MSNRKDNKKRNLRNGEYQRYDGRYEYRFKDENGISRSIYSRRLVATDSGTDIPLRELETEILKGERRVTKRRTFDDAFNDYILAAPCREHVKSLKKYWYELHIKSYFGEKDISKITNTDIQKYYRYLGMELGYSSSYVEEMHSIINGVFKNEIVNRNIQYNPAENLGKTLKYLSAKPKNNREALTSQEQEAFLWALDNADISKNVKYLIRFLLGTGCRISEALSIKWCDVDFVQECITIERSFVTGREDSGKCDRKLSEPKTESGKRIIPMIPLITDLLYAMQTDAMADKDEFIFLNPSGKPYTRGNIDIMLRRVRNNYNDGIYGYFGEVNELPLISAHVLRYTFCTRLCENVTDMSGLKNVAAIMGHASVNMTLKVYVSVDVDRKKEIMQKVENKLLN